MKLEIFTFLEKVFQYSCNYERRRRRHHHVILCFLTSQRTQHLRHQNTCVVVFMYGINLCLFLINVNQIYILKYI